MVNNMVKKIYVSHSRKFNFKKELYEPLKNLNEIKFIFPHEKSEKSKLSKNIIKSSSVMIAEVSYPSTSVGIEIGWADSFNVPIIYLYKKNSKISSSLKIVSKNFIEYDKIESILPKIEHVLKNLRR